MARDLASRSIFSLIVFLYLFSFPHPFLADSPSFADSPNIHSLHYFYEQTQFQHSLSQISLQADSIYTGRKCKLVLFNGFEAVGIIIYITADSLRFKTDNNEYAILIKDMKYVMDKDEDVSEREDVGYQIEKLQKRDSYVGTTSKECDIYLSRGIVLKDVSLFINNDTTLLAYSGSYKREIKLSDIKKIVFKGSGGFGTGFLIGAIAGFSAGFLPLAFSKSEGHGGPGGPGLGVVVGLIFALPAGLAGGVVGAFLDKDDVYIFESGLSKNKHSMLKYIILKHKEYGE